MKPLTPRRLKKWRKELPPHLQGKDRTRELVRIRDNRTCRRCGKLWAEGTRRLDVHHLNGQCGKRSRKYDRIADINNLITLCHYCHFRHHEFSQAIKYGVIKECKIEPTFEGMPDFI